MILGINKVTRRLRIKIPRPHAAHDGFPLANEQSAALSRRLVPRMREHVAHDSRRHSDLHHEKAIPRRHEEHEDTMNPNPCLCVLAFVRTRPWRERDGRPRKPLTQLAEKCIYSVRLGVSVTPW